MRKTNRPNQRAVFVIALLAVLALGTSALGQTENTLYNFTGGPDGNGPVGNLIFDSLGNLYGTTDGGGIGGAGVVFELSPTTGGGWTETVLYAFRGGTDGQLPISGVVFHDGSLYGTTVFGGAKGNGTFFELSPASGGGWTETILYSFAGGADGSGPYASPVFDAAGNIYGTTLTGGAANAGTAFELSPASGGWTESVIHNFAVNDSPSGPLILGPNGTLFGTTQGFGSNNGTVFALTFTSSGWKKGIIYKFLGGTDGSDPQGGVILGPNRRLYGVTEGGGSASAGTAYELIPSTTGAWTETQLYAFGSGRGDPLYPTNLVFDASKHHLWGVTGSGGNSGNGAAFKLTFVGGVWKERKVFSFPTGGPLGGIVLDSAGNLFGPGNGGTSGAGVVYQLVP